MCCRDQQYLEKIGETTEACDPCTSTHNVNTYKASYNSGWEYENFPNGVPICDECIDNMTKDDIVILTKGLKWAPEEELV